MSGAEFQHLNRVVTVGLLVLFFGGTLTMSIAISRKRENADGYMTAGNKLGFGISAASMTATWIWAASMYASATSGYKYGLSGPIHYGLWGALMILFIYPFGRRIRKVAPRAHTLAEVMYARHGRSSQLMLAGSNVLGSLISLTSNFIAGGALISLLSPFSFSQGILIIASGVLLYTLWSGFRASVLTDFAQVLAMLGAVTIIIPSVFFLAGGPSMFVDGAANLPRSNRTSSPQSPSSSRARPISRLFWHTRSAIRRLRSDCSQSVRTSSRMVLATGAGLFFASGQMNILDLLVFVGALWGALVFPVIASFYWGKVTNKAFTVSVLAALAVFIPVRFELFSMAGATGYLFDILSTVGIGVVLGLMAFGFFGLRPALLTGVVSTLAFAPFTIGFLHDYATLSGSLFAYSVSTVICYFMSFRNEHNFDFNLIKKRTGDFDTEEVEGAEPIIKLGA